METSCKCRVLHMRKRASLRFAFQTQKYSNMKKTRTEMVSRNQEESEIWELKPIRQAKRETSKKYEVADSTFSLSQYSLHRRSVSNLQTQSILATPRPPWSNKPVERSTGHNRWQWLFSQVQTSHRTGWLARNSFGVKPTKFRIDTNCWFHLVAPSVGVRETNSSR